MKLSTTSVGSLLLGLAGLASVVQAGGQHLARAGAGSDPSKHAQVARKLWKRFSGRATFYDPNTGNQGACGGFIGTNDWVVAINTDQYAGGAHCGQSVTISANGVTQTAVIRDACPGCGYGGLDMTPGLFSAFADHSVGVLQITWNFGGSSGGGGNNNNNDRTTSTSSRWTSQYTPPSSTSQRWTPTSTSSWRRTSTSSQWTPSSSHRESSSTWSPPPSSSSTRSSSSSSWSSSSSEWSSSSVHPSNATIAINVLAPNATATESSGSTAPEATTSNTPLLSPSSNNTSTSNTHGALANMAQVVLRMATVVVAAADTA